MTTFLYNSDAIFSIGKNKFTPLPASGLAGNNQLAYKNTFKFR
jgi:hypothetical protein